MNVDPNIIAAVVGAAISAGVIILLAIIGWIWSAGKLAQTQKTHDMELTRIISDIRDIKQQGGGDCCQEQYRICEGMFVRKETHQRFERQVWKALQNIDNSMKEIVKDRERSRRELTEKWGVISKYMARIDARMGKQEAGNGQ